MFFGPFVVRREKGSVWWRGYFPPYSSLDMIEACCGGDGVLDGKYMVVQLQTCMKWARKGKVHGMLLSAWSSSFRVDEVDRVHISILDSKGSGCCYKDDDRHHYNQQVDGKKCTRPIYTYIICSFLFSTLRLYGKWEKGGAAADVMNGLWRRN